MMSLIQKLEILMIYTLMQLNGTKMENALSLLMR